ncbi:MAG: ADP-forming succinate--CoA ligase subunit beta [Armatimonadota bacterium]
MKLHEYQARDLLASYAVPVPAGEVAATPEQAREMAERLGGKVVVKAQVLMGGRGKAGGVKLCNSPAEAAEFTRSILGKRLVSVQNPEGMVVELVLVVPMLDIVEEYYVGILLDRAKQQTVAMVSAAGGMDIEEVAAKTPEAIAHIPVNPKWGLWEYEVRDSLTAIGFRAEHVGQMASMVTRLARAYAAEDATLVEVNPCALLADGKIVAADAKVTIDDAALFRRPQWKEYADDAAGDPIEAEAARRGIAYVRLDGNVGVLGNGAGLVMLTLDEIARAGEKAANFLDVGGGAQADRVKDCMELVLMDDRVKAILVNIFGGITRGDEVARGIIAATEKLEVNVPIVVRVEGTNAAEAREILAKANLLPTATVQEAAEKVHALLAS